jgi:hypothetical protein
MTTHRRLQTTMRNPIRKARRAKNLRRQVHNGRAHNHGERRYGPRLPIEFLYNVFDGAPKTRKGL